MLRGKQDERTTAAFAREVAILSAAKHPQVLQYLGVCAVNGHTLLVRRPRCCAGAGSFLEASLHLLAAQLGLQRRTLATVREPTQKWCMTFGLTWPVQRCRISPASGGFLKIP